MTTKRENHWIDVLPSMAISWSGGITIYVGWLFWNVIVFV